MCAIIIIVIDPCLMLKYFCEVNTHFETGNLCVTVVLCASIIVLKLYIPAEKCIYWVKKTCLHNILINIQFGEYNFYGNLSPWRVFLRKSAHKCMFSIVCIEDERFIRCHFSRFWVGRKTFTVYWFFFVLSSIIIGSKNFYKTTCEPVVWQKTPYGC